MAIVLIMLTLAACSQTSVGQPATSVPSDLTLKSIAKAVRKVDPTAAPTSVDISLRGHPNQSPAITPVRARAWAGTDSEVSVIVETFHTHEDAVQFDQAHARANQGMYRSITRIAAPVHGATAFTCGCGGDTIVSFVRGATRVFIELSTPITARVAKADRLARDIDDALSSGARPDARV
jgi:hypothetical protein